MYQYLEFFWSVFSRIRTEYRAIRSISPYSVGMREKCGLEKLRKRTLFMQWYCLAHLLKVFTKSTDFWSSTHWECWWCWLWWDFHSNHIWHCVWIRSRCFFFLCISCSWTKWIWWCSFLFENLHFFTTVCIWNDLKTVTTLGQT